MEVPEYTPIRFDVSDVAGFKSHLDEHGCEHHHQLRCSPRGLHRHHLRQPVDNRARDADACVKEAASPAELEHARDLLWEHLEGRDSPLMRQERPVGWKRDDVSTWRDGHGDGLMTSATHSACMWYIRTLPGVLGGFAAAYGTDEIVSAYAGASAPFGSDRGQL